MLKLKQIHHFFHPEELFCCIGRIPQRRLYLPVPLVATLQMGKGQKSISAVAFAHAAFTDASKGKVGGG